MNKPSALCDETLRVVVKEEPDGSWVAEGVDLFVHGRGRTMEEAVEAVARDFRIQVILDKHQPVSERDLALLRRDAPDLLDIWRQAEVSGRIQTRPMSLSGSNRAVSKLQMVCMSTAA